MFGAGLGILLGAGITFDQLVLLDRPFVAGTAGLSVIAINASILLLLVGNPSTGRVLSGRILFGISLVLFIVSVVTGRPTS
jgi:hypothetical protein